MSRLYDVMSVNATKLASPVRSGRRIEPDAQRPAEMTTGAAQAAPAMAGSNAIWIGAVALDAAQGRRDSQWGMTLGT
jgi:hypothetical protein